MLVVSWDWLAETVKLDVMLLLCFKLDKAFCALVAGWFLAVLRLAPSVSLDNSMVFCFSKPWFLVLYLPVCSSIYLVLGWLLKPWSREAGNYYWLDKAECKALLAVPVKETGTLFTFALSVKRSFLEPACLGVIVDFTF